MSWAGAPPPNNPNWQENASQYHQTPQQQQQYSQYGGQFGQYGGGGGGGGSAPPPGQYGNPYGGSPVPGGQYGGQQYGSQVPGGYYQQQQQGPQPPPGVSHELWQWFIDVDEDRSGQITAAELQRALMNGNWRPFNEETCRLMIGMFDRNRNGTIDVQEFAALWKYIQDWKTCFERFDVDRSGNIDVREFHSAVTTFGYNLSMDFAQMIVRRFDRTGRGTIDFDAFIQSCVMLKNYTDAFRQADTNQQGIITIHYEQFLIMVLDHVLK